MTNQTTDAEIGELSIRARREIVFIESDVADIGTLVQGIGAGKEVIVLDAAGDSLRQIADALAGRTGIDALHIVSHGASGSARLGSLMLDTQGIGAHQDTLQEIGRSLRPGGDILLYGCEIGGGSGGAGFVEQLAIATGADVAASSDPTGAASLGGDWDLEVGSGSIETAPVADARNAALYQQVLAIPSVVVNFDNFAFFTSPGHPSDAALDARYRVNGDFAYQLVLDGQDTGTVAYDGVSGVFVATGGAYAPEDALNISFLGGQVFTPTSISIANWDNYIDYPNQDQTLVIKGYNAANQQVGLTRTFTLLDNNSGGDFSADVISLNGMTGITRLEVTATTQGGKIQYILIESITMSNVQPPPPKLMSVDSATPDGSYNTGDTIDITLEFDQAVEVSGGVPTLRLETGSTDRDAVFHSVSGSTVTFRYTVQAGDTSTDLSYAATNSLSLNGATIRAAGGGSAADTALPVPGNLGSLSANAAIVIDTTAPTVAVTSNMSTLKAGETATITFTFSEAPTGFSNADISVSGGALGAISGSGLVRSAVFTPTAGIDSGSASITVAAASYTDAAGNLGGAGASPAITYDTKAPTLSISSDRPTLKIGETALITFTFSEDPGASFTLGDIVLSGGSLSGFGGSGSTRSATFTPTPNTNGGVASITVAAGSYTDAAGNGGGAGSTPALSFDTLAPNAPATPDLAAGSDSGSSATDNNTSDAQPELRGGAGSAEAGATIRVYDGATLVGTTTALGDGSWSVDSSTLADGIHTITATATDAAGNTGAASGALTLTIDRSAPAAPAAPDLAAASDSGSSDSDDVTASNTPLLAGAAGSVAGLATIRLYDTDGTTVIATTAAAADGSWSVATVALSEGEHSITATAVDAAGNESPPSAVLVITVDRTKPGTTVASAQFSADTGASDSDMITSQAAQTVSGTLSANLLAGERVEVSLDNGATWDPASASTGSNTWSVAATLAGSDTLQVRVVDAAGNAGTAYTRAYTLDTSAPAAPSAPDLVDASDTGSENDDNITGDTTPTFKGTAEAGSKITVYDGGSAIGTTVAGGDGTWSFTSGVLAHGNHTIAVTASDAAGNESSVSTGLAVTIDTSAPATAADSMALSADTGASASDFVTNTAAQTISGKLGADLAAGERVEVSVDGGNSWNLATAATGSRDWSLAATLAAGEGTIKVRVTNAVDNSGPVLSQDYVLDTTAPGVTITSDKATLKAGESAQITFTFSEDPGASFTSGDIVVSGGILSGFGGSGAIRTATFTPDADVDAGTASITIGAGAYQDLAGNGGGAGLTPPLSYDTLAPAAPSAPLLASASDHGFSNNDGVTSDATPSFAGTAAAGATVLLFDADGNQVGSGSADGAGNWTITTGVLPDGEHAISARTRDAAGNLSVAGAATALRVDTAAPTLSITSSVAQLKAGQTATITFTFSEDPWTSFTAADITVSGGTLGPLSGTGKVRSAVFTPTAGLDADVATISVGAAGYMDAAGNLGGAGAPLSLQFDTLAPAAPGAPRLALASDTGTPGDGVTGRSRPVIEGNAAANSVVRLYDGATLVGSATADGTGAWSIATNLGSGNHALSATQLDAAGNESAASASFALRIEAPPAPPPPPTTVIDGVPVLLQPVVLPGGTRGSSVSIPVITGGRTETSGNENVADIPLATAEGNHLLLAQLPVGYGLSASGANVDSADALAFLLASIRAATPAHTPQDQGHLTGNGQSFLAGLGAGSSLLVQTVAPVNSAAPSGALILSGAPPAPGQRVALVIDATGLAGGGTIELQHVDFAAVIGSAEVVARSGNPILTGDAASQRFTIHSGGSGAVFAGGGDDILGYGFAPAPAAQGTQQRALTLPAPATTMLHGGLAEDSVSFAGTRSQYELVLHHGYAVVSSKAAPGQRAIVVNAEHLKFSDISLTLEHAAGLDTLAGMYHAVLGRQADLLGFEFWADAHEGGMGWGAIALQLVGSSEHAASHGGFNGQSAHDLGLLYAALFGRAADAQGLAYWQGVMERGATLEQVATAFVESAEMVGHRIGATGWDFSV